MSFGGSAGVGEMMNCVVTSRVNHFIACHSELLLLLSRAVDASGRRELISVLLLQSGLKHRENFLLLLRVACTIAHVFHCAENSGYV